MTIPTIFACLHGCGVLLPERGVCAACTARYIGHVAEIATTQAPAAPWRCDQCNREHLPSTACVSWTEHCSMRDTLTAQRDALAAELEAVRRVEAWTGGATGRHVVQCADGRFVAAHYPAQQTAGAERIAAGPLDLVSLGRALAAQEAGDGMR